MDNEWKKLQRILPKKQQAVEESDPSEGRKAGTDKPGAQRLLRRAGLTKAKGHALVLLDCSTSMGEAGKLEHARSGAVEFGEEAIGRGYDVGFASFASDASPITACGGDVGMLRAAVARVVAHGTTNLADGLHRAAEALNDTAQTRVVIVCTDGYPDDPERAIAEARKLHEAGVGIMVVGTVDANRDFLRLIASQSFFATIVDDAEIGRQLGRQAKELPKLTSG